MSEDIDQRNPRWFDEDSFGDHLESLDEPDPGAALPPDIRSAMDSFADELGAAILRGYQRCEAEWQAVGGRLRVRGKGLRTKVDYQRSADQDPVLLTMFVMGSTGLCITAGDLFAGYDFDKPTARDDFARLFAKCDIPFAWE